MFVFKPSRKHTHQHIICSFSHRFFMCPTSPSLLLITQPCHSYQVRPHHVVPGQSGPSTRKGMLSASPNTSLVQEDSRGWKNRNFGLLVWRSNLPSSTGTSRKRLRLFVFHRRNATCVPSATTTCPHASCAGRNSVTVASPSVIHTRGPSSTRQVVLWTNGAPLAPIAGRIPPSRRSGRNHQWTRVTRGAHHTPASMGVGLSFLCFTI